MYDSIGCNDDGEKPRPASVTRRPSGFTLVELVVVMVIIGIILVFLLAASRSALRSAQEKATQGLIGKLDSAVSDRVDAILQSRVSEPSAANGIVAAIYDGVTPPSLGQTLERAYVLAQIELFQREMPDVFFDQTQMSGYTGNYPINFAANPYPIADGSPNAVLTPYPSTYPDAPFVLPLGSGWPVSQLSSPPTSNYFNPGQGIYGASYHVAAGVYKNLGYYPTGYDGVDNNKNGLVDEWAEGVDTANQPTVQAHLSLHKHKTARAEVLYALLVDSTGPFGSIFTADDFTDKEVQDTDGDGLPEFVDAWGEPLQFYRWPLFFHSDLQHGQQFVSGATGDTAFLAPYDDMIQQRELDALDPNQQLMSPAWWSSSYNDAPTYNPNPPYFPAGFAAGAGGWSSGVAFFENYFHLLHEPLFSSSPQANPPPPPTTPGQYFWDRGAGATGGPFAARRAFSSKFLILSAGPDKELGVFEYDDAGLQADIAAIQGSNPYAAAFPLLGMENLAAPLAYGDLQMLVSPSGGGVIGGLISGSPSLIPPPPPIPSSLDIQTQGQDDINNHNIPAGGIGGSAP